MPSAEERHKAQQADRLLNHEPVLTAAIASLRQRTLEALAGVDPTNADEIRKLQAVIFACESIPMELEQMIIAGQSTDTQPEQSTAVN